MSGINFEEVKKRVDAKSKRIHEKIRMLNNGIDLLSPRKRELIRMIIDAKSDKEAEEVLTRRG